MSKDIFAGKQLNDLKCYIRYDKAYSEAKEYDLLFLFKKIKVWELLSNTKIKQWEKEDLIEYFTHGIKVKPEHYREFKEVINAENLDYLALGLDENISKFTLQRKVQFLNEITTNIFHREDLKLNVKDIEIDIKVKMDTIYNKEEIIDICNSLANIQDRFIIYAMFNCVRGNESSDLLQIKEQDVDLENKIIKLKSGKILQMDDYMESIVRDLLNPKINSHYFFLDSKYNRAAKFAESEYLIKTYESERYDNSKKPLTYEGFLAKLQKLSSAIGKKISVKDIYRSGVLHKMNEFSDYWTVNLIESFIKKNDFVGTPRDLKEKFNYKYHNEKLDIQK